MLPCVTLTAKDVCSYYRLFVSALINAIITYLVDHVKAFYHISHYLHVCLTLM